jgi:hypothetical protein
MRHPWTTFAAIAGMATLIVGPAVAQTSGSGTGAPAPGSGASTPGKSQSPLPTPSPTQPGAQAPSVGAPTGKAAPGTAQPGGSPSGTTGSGTVGSGTTTSGSGSGQMGSGAQASDSKQPGATNGQAGMEQVKGLQQALQGKGLDPGPIDGVMGPKTQAAIRAFQKDQNLPQTGRMDDQTAAKLGISR